MFCHNCGAPVEENSKFCSSCGTCLAKDNDTIQEQAQGQTPPPSSASEELLEDYERLKANRAHCPKAIKKIALKEGRNGTGKIELRGFFFRYSCTRNTTPKLEWVGTWYVFLFISLCIICDYVFWGFFEEEDCNMVLTVCFLAENLLWILLVVFSSLEEKKVSDYVQDTLGCRFSAVGRIIRTIILLAFGVYCLVCGVIAMQDIIWH